MKETKIKITIIRFSSLGDVILQLPMVSAIKTAYPKSYITFITAKPCDELIRGHVHIDDVVVYEKSKGIADLKSLWDFSKSIESDLIIDLHGNTRSMMFRLFSYNVPTLKVDKRDIQRNLLIFGKINTLSNKPHASRLLEEFKGILSIKLSEKELRKELNHLSRTKKNIGLTTLPSTFSSKTEKSDFKKYIIVAPSASFETKRWKASSYKKLIVKLLEDLHFNDFQILLIAGPEDNFCRTYDELEDRFKGRFFNLQGKTDLFELTEYIRDCHLTIGNDSVFGHISEAFGNPAISIFGPTTPEFGFKPHLELSKSISESIWCKPCSKTGSLKCFRDKQYCLDEIGVDQVFNEVVDSIEKIGEANV